MMRRRRSSRSSRSRMKEEAEDTPRWMTWKMTARKRRRQPKKCVRQEEGGMRKDEALVRAIIGYV